MQQIFNTAENVESYASLVHIPPELASLQHLTILLIEGLVQVEIPASLPRSLKDVCISGSIGRHGQLTSFPDALLDLVNLSTLDLSLNQLTSIPSGVSKLTNLDELKVTANCITSIAASIGQLSSLVYLDLQCNPLERLPIEFAQLTQLVQLKMPGSSVPCSWCSGAHLSSSFPPQDTVSKGTQAILAYLRGNYDLSLSPISLPPIKLLEDSLCLCLQIHGTVASA